MAGNGNDSSPADAFMTNAVAADLPVPDEILDYVVSLVSPYGALRACARVNRR